MKVATIAAAASAALPLASARPAQSNSDDITTSLRVVTAHPVPSSKSTPAPFANSTSVAQPSFAHPLLGPLLPSFGTAHPSTQLLRLPSGQLCCSNLQCACVLRSSFDPAALATSSVPVSLGTGLPAASSSAAGPFANSSSFDPAVVVASSTQAPLGTGTATVTQTMMITLSLNASSLLASSTPAPFANSSSVAPTQTVMVTMTASTSSTNSASSSSSVPSSVAPQTATVTRTVMTFTVPASTGPVYARPGMPTMMPRAKRNVEDHTAAHPLHGLGDIVRDQVGDDTHSYEDHQATKGHPPAYHPSAQQPSSPASPNTPNGPATSAAPPQTPGNQARLRRQIFPPPQQKPTIPAKQFSSAAVPPSSKSSTTVPAKSAGVPPSKSSPILPSTPVVPYKGAAGQNPAGGAITSTFALLPIALFILW
ncbi:Hypothetical predicted protein [Lecanosticta acicola]|uniref:Uncharacterized protein n=1 Tax=Lecanosticta acicola TaxID=111012 RepID=A0AAI8Z2R9_9PEZI|nr:Hypothetical predicted protein [Lecanosticta acicola]